MQGESFAAGCADSSLKSKARTVREVPAAAFRTWIDAQADTPRFLGTAPRFLRVLLRGIEALAVTERVGA